MKERRNGCGTMHWFNGDEYTGEFSADLYDGQGTLKLKARGGMKYMPGCTTYTGGWKEGKKHGQGKCYDFYGVLLYEGEYQYDFPVGRYNPNFIPPK